MSGLYGNESDAGRSVRRGARRVPRNGNLRSGPGLVSLGPKGPTTLGSQTFRSDRLAATAKQRIAFSAGQALHFAIGADRSYRKR